MTLAYSTNLKATSFSSYILPTHLLDQLVETICVILIVK